MQIVTSFAQQGNSSPSLKKLWPRCRHNRLAFAVLLGLAVCLRQGAACAESMFRATTPFPLFLLAAAITITALLLFLALAWIYRLRREVGQHTAALQESNTAALHDRQLVRSITETSPVGIVTFDATGVITFANQQAERILRLQSIQLCGRRYDDPLWRLTDLDGRPFNPENLLFPQVMKSNSTVRDMHVVIEHADGEQTILSCCGTPLVTADNEVNGMVCTVEDVTAQIKDASEQEQRWRRAQRQRNAITHITQNRAFVLGDLDAAARLIARHGAEALDVNATGLWMLDAPAGELRCVAAWDKEKNTWVQPPALPINKIVQYLGTLESERYVDAPDAQHDPRLAELCPEYILPGNIGARIDVPIRVSGKLAGVLGIDHQGMARQWRGDEIQFALELAQEAGQAFAAHEKRRAEEERRVFEAKLQHTQKLESLGILAGGIAHDFNNLLMAIIGNAELALMDISHANPACKSVKEIEAVSRRAADLCNQLLAYSGKGNFVIEPVCLNEVITEIGHMLDVTITKNIALRYDLTENLPVVEVDVSQMRQVLMNLVINASEAIGEKNGVITVRTGAFYCDKEYLERTHIHEDLAEGDYVSIEVDDTGEGMDKASIARIFEPFYTTKIKGRGLGLAAVLGIVHGHKGALKVYSEPQKGATFKVLLPASDKAAISHTTTAALDANWRGSGTVLLVDDEEALLTVSSKMLNRLGFHVLTASNGVEALGLFGQMADEVCCVILDLTMPNMNGVDCFRELRRIRTDVPVLLSSGFNEKEATQRFVGKGLAGFVQKPYRFATLATKLSEVLRD